MHDLLQSVWRLPERQFDVFKILLDKGALALLIASAGAVGAILLERYKTALKKQEIQSGVTVPLVLDLMKDVGALFNLGNDTLATLAQQFPAFEQWARALVAAPVLRVTQPKPENASLRKFPLTLSNGTGTTFGDLMVSTGPDSLTQKVAASATFWSDDTFYKSGGFFSLVFDLLIKDPTDRPDMLGIIRHSMLDVFERHVVEDRNTYEEEWRKVLLKLMMSLDIKTRRQRAAYEGASDALASARELVLRFPKDDIAYSALSNANAATIHWLHKAIRAA